MDRSPTWFAALSAWFKARPRAGLKLLVLLAGVLAFAQVLPKTLFDEPQSTLLLDRQGRLLAAHIAADEQWRFPYRDRVPERFKTAITYYEDKRFAWHHGIDPVALLRATALNLRNGRVVSGGSTLTMQVVRLSRGNPPRTYAEKLLEMVLALRLELSYSKDEILALYAAHAPFGGNVVGLETAAWRYFGRSSEDLSWAETCTLAVLPNNPAMIHPGRNRESLREKRDELLHTLHAEGVLSDIELSTSLREALPERPHPMPHHASHLLQTLMAAHPGEHRFITTLDFQRQVAAQGLVTRHSRALSLQEIHNAAAIVVDNQSFEVVAYVGNSNLSDAYELGYAIDLIQRPRSSGSILKPLLFAAMLQNGDILPDTLVPDLPTQYNGYIPENYDQRFRGAVPAKEALARSLNIPAVRMLKQFGVDRFYDILRNMGMSSLFRRPDDYGLTLILGGAEVTPWDMAGIYANLADIGRAAYAGPEQTYKRLRLLQGDDSSTDHLRDIQPAAAWLTLNALQEVSRPGDEGYWKNFSSSRKVAWKTGTSYGLRDAWAIGSTARYTVAVWVGNASGEGVAGLTGVNSAAPLMFDLFNLLGDDSWFERPDALMKQVRVCVDDGFLDNGFCETREEWIPAESHFSTTSRNHYRIHLDKSGRWRVNSQCESVSNMQHRDWFVLPPGQEYYYRQNNASYKPLPRWRKDCRAYADDAQTSPMEILYPSEDTRIYIPIYLSGEKGRTVFLAVHRDSKAVIHWHLDDLYVGSTRVFHNLALDIGPGMHKLTLVDGEGHTVTRWFEILAKERTQ